jgi:hypothetical protein
MLCKSQQWFWDCDGLHNGHFEFVIILWVSHPSNRNDGRKREQNLSIFKIKSQHPIWSLNLDQGQEIWTLIQIGEVQIPRATWHVTAVDLRDITSPNADNPKSSAMDVDSLGTWNQAAQINKPLPHQWEGADINQNTGFQRKEPWRQQGQTLWKAELYQHGRSDTLGGDSSRYAQHNDLSGECTILYRGNDVFHFQRIHRRIRS